MSNGSDMTVTTALSLPTRDELDSLASAAGISRARLIREILEDFLTGQSSDVKLSKARIMRRTYYMSSSDMSNGKAYNSATGRI
jgi:hypothetical protein